MDKLYNVEYVDKRSHHGIMDIIIIIGCTTRDFISDYGSKYPDALSIGYSMSFLSILFLMYVHENEMK